MAGEDTALDAPADGAAEEDVGQVEQAATGRFVNCGSSEAFPTWGWGGTTTVTFRNISGTGRLRPWSIELGPPMRST
jgi:hypothetical protein